MAVGTNATMDIDSVIKKRLEMLDEEVTYPYIISMGPGTGQIKYISRPEGITVRDMVRDEIMGGILTRGGKWFLVMGPTSQKNQHWETTN